MNTKQSRLGFTLIELIIVIAIIAIIAAITYVSLDPARRLNSSKNATRRSDVSAIADAITLKLVDTQSVAGIDNEPGTWQMLGIGNDCDVGNCNIATGGVEKNCLDLEVELVDGGYLGRMPYDPTVSSLNSKTYYVLNKQSSMTIVRSCLAEGEGVGGSGTPPLIEATR